MLRTALQPRWLALLALVVVLCVAFGWLGSWQLGVARDKGARKAAEQVAARPPAALDDVLVAQQPFPTSADARAVHASGTYDPTRQVLVAERLQHGRSGWWVVAALRTSSGGWLPVVRGWVPSPQDPAADPSHAPSGVVEVTGVLQPDDAPGDGAAALPDGQLAALDAAELVNRWGSPIYNGYLVAASEQPAGVGAQPERASAPRPQPHGIAWRNAAYAVQWWVFAGFALVLWWKMVRQDQRERAEADREKVGA
ncbi:SURF1 family protein [Angustibacter sp. McL0619]|uniref:SURF1 family protein n=1 Tax=Angustibacter sp. McL0619 TaxID=3415676 RepID=UPI003CF864AF